MLTAQLELRGNSQTLGGLTTGTPIFGTSGNNRVVNGSATFALLTLNHDSSYTYNGVLGNSNANDDNFGLIKAGAGTQILGGSNTFAGPLTIAGGLLEVTNGFAIPDTCAVVLSNEPGATLALDANETIGSLSGGGAAGGSIALGSRTLSVIQTAPGVFAGAISGSGSLVKTGAAALTLSGASTFSGAVTVQGGPLVVTSSSALGAGNKNINLNNGSAGQGQLRLDGSAGPVTLPEGFVFHTSWMNGTVINDAGTNTILGSFDLTSGGGDTSIVVSNGSLTLTGNCSPSASVRSLLLGGAGFGVVSGVISDGATYPLASVQKRDAGTWTLSGTNTFSGATVVSGGTLVVSGLLPTNTVTVSSNGTLAGDGVIRGAVSVASGGTLSPGTGNFAPLTISNRLTLQADSSTYLELAAAAHTNDQVLGLTGVTYGGSLAVTNLGGTFHAGDAFKFFHAATRTGAFSSVTLPLLPAGLGWTNRLGVDGSIQVLSTVPTAPPTLVWTVPSANSLSLSWPTGYVGYRLQAQTNSPSFGLRSNWFTLAGATNPPVLVPINPANGSVFFRLFCAP